MRHELRSCKVLIAGSMESTPERGGHSVGENDATAKRPQKQIIDWGEHVGAKGKPFDVCLSLP